ncbi:hypothetical protein ACIGXF_18865 [Streptomyces sp. NPDC053086]|uniref:hypothetical protein n=1 Tax=unclassified Streptomyces TaxID=2593676 RepID=UPI0037D7B59E
MRAAGMSGGRRTGTAACSPTSPDDQRGAARLVKVCRRGGIRLDGAPGAPERWHEHHFGRRGVNQ